MLKSDLLKKIQKENNGILRTKTVVDNGISRTYFMEYVRKNKFEKISQGIYLAPNSWTDGLYLLQLRFKGIIFSHETALYLGDLTDREPLQYTVTVKTGYNYFALSQQNIKVYSIKKELYELGAIQILSPGGHELRCYNAERTLCDILRSRNNIEIQDFQNAIKNYIKSKSKNIPLLMRYAKELHVEAILRKYLEVLM